jgi:hypothetical protein
MACLTLSKGRKLACKGGQGGFKAISITPWVEGLIVGATGSLTTMPAGLSASYRYQLKNTGNTYEEAIASDAETRNVSYNGTLNVVLQKFDIDTKNEIALLTLGEVVIFIEDYNGNVFLIGSGNGADLSGGNFATGGARTDMTGWKLTFTTMEVEPFLLVTGAAKTSYAGLVVNGV